MLSKVPRTFVKRFFSHFISHISVTKDVIEFIGIVEETFPNAAFQVRIVSPQAKDHQLLCHLAGKMRVRRVRVLPGDRVKVEMTPYDLQKGRIVYRFSADAPQGTTPVPQNLP